MTVEGRSVIGKVRRRILPFVFVLYVVAFLDRVNVAFAKVSMSQDLGFSETVFGFGAGIFFAGYLLLEIPGALIVERWSARKWLARILVTWGLCTVVIGFVRTPGEFYAARFVLGAAEAGFFPGVVVYLSHWFPESDRARALSGLIMAVPFSQIVGAPLSGLILSLDWLSLEGWRWLFILEGLPAVALGFVTLRYLDDRPASARWLTEEEKLWLTHELTSERAGRDSQPEESVLGAVARALREKSVLLLAIALCCANVGTYAFQLWLPSVLKQRLGLTPQVAAVWAAVPFVAALSGMAFVGLSSDRTGERRFHAIVPLILSATFFFASTRESMPGFGVMVFLSLTGMAAYAWPSPFWALPSRLLSRSAAAASVGFINAVGNLGGLIGPPVIGILLDSGRTLEMAMSVISIGFLLSGILLFFVKIDPGLRKPL